MTSSRNRTASRTVARSRAKSTRPPATKRARLSEPRLQDSYGRARLELRHGAAAEHVVQVADAEQADMIALAWSQRLDPGRAAAVRRTILEAEVPVMLIPMPED
jgi:nucleotide-binding universal stress UspA family protein